MSTSVEHCDNDLRKTDGSDLVAHVKLGDTMTRIAARLSTSCHLRRETEQVNQPVWEGV
jgi:hypothetical protein